MKIRTCRGQMTVKKSRNFPISSPKPDLYNINAHIKFSENPLTLTQIIVRKRKYGRTDVRQTDGHTDGHTDSQRDTIIHRHYRVTGYKNQKKNSNTSSKPIKSQVLLCVCILFELRLIYILSSVQGIAPETNGIHRVALMSEE